MTQAKQKDDGMGDKAPRFNGSNTRTPDMMTLGPIMIDVYTRAIPLLNDFFTRNIEQFDHIADKPLDPLGLRKAFLEIWAHALQHPQAVMDAQIAFWNTWMDVANNTMLRFQGENAAPLFRPEKTDKRFKDPVWEESAFFNFLQQSYLMMTQKMLQHINANTTLKGREKQRLDFYMRRFAEAMSPSNFALTNPKVIRETLATGGENLIQGLKNFLTDLERGEGMLKISTTKTDAFKVGENIACTPGSVVFENDLMQLIQYAPTTKDVQQTPILIVPPWINKYYILDLAPHNSMIKWLVAQGHTVFVISWVNPTEKDKGTEFFDYAQKGIFPALDVVEDICKTKHTNVVGYCIGGTLLAMALAYLKTKKQDKRVASATFFTTLLDFENPGDLGIFIDDMQLEMMEAEMKAKGYLSADTLKATFSILRANDMIWSFVVNNYLLGKEPFPFDLLYWNDDSTNIPAAMHSYYLRNMYRNNLLVEPGALMADDVPVDLGTITTPSYILSTKDDHIAPWQSTYKNTHLFGGDVTFTLAASGHIAGVINPPGNTKYGHWTSTKDTASPITWLKSAAEQKGSWWPHWNTWLQQFSNDKVAARKPGSSKAHPAIEPAPGRYVMKKA